LKGFSKTFVQLNRNRRQKIGLRISHDQKMLADLYDHFLIERSLAEPGASIAWERFQL
jgi:hypothetical protein